MNQCCDLIKSEGKQRNVPSDIAEIVQVKLVIDELSTFPFPFPLPLPPLLLVESNNKTSGPLKSATNKLLPLELAKNPISDKARQD